MQTDSIGARLCNWSPAFLGTISRPTVATPVNKVQPDQRGRTADSKVFAAEEGKVNHSLACLGRDDYASTAGTQLARTFVGIVTGSHSRSKILGSHLCYPQQPSRNVFTTRLTRTRNRRLIYLPNASYLHLTGGVPLNRCPQVH